MSVTIMSDVMYAGPDDATDNHVLLILSSFANHDGQSCYPSIPLIAKLTRLTERTIKRSLKSLEAQGFLRILQKGDGRGNITAYEVETERLAKVAYAKRQEWRPKRVTLTTIAPKRVTQMHPFPAQKGDSDDSERVTLTTGKGDFDDNPPDPLLGRNVIDSKAKTLSLSPRLSTGQEGERDDGTPTPKFPQPPPGDGDPVAIARSVCNAYPRNAHLRSHELNPAQVAAVIQAIRSEAINGETTQTDAGMMLLAQVDALALAIRGQPGQMKFLPPADRFFAERLYRQAPEYFTRTNTTGGGLTNGRPDRIQRAFSRQTRAN